MKWYVYEVHSRRLLRDEKTQRLRRWLGDRGAMAQASSQNHDHEGRVLLGYTDLPDEKWIALSDENPKAQMALLAEMT